MTDHSQATTKANPTKTGGANGWVMSWMKWLLAAAGMVPLLGCGDDDTRKMGQTLTVDLPGGAKMEMVWIEPGRFLMGSPASESARDYDEKPQHEVRISRGFYLGKYEIIQGQWEAVMGTTPWLTGQDSVRYNAHDQAEYVCGRHHYVLPNSNNPAVFISWYDTQDFIHRLNETAGDSLYRLPTEAEWEYACRAGTTTRWSFGNDESQLEHYAWFRDNIAGEDYAHPVGMKQPNPWGLYDMHGNVEEWVQDLYGFYTSATQIDPTGPVPGSDHVYRGGLSGQEIDPAGPDAEPKRVFRGGSFFYIPSWGTWSAVRYFDSPSVQHLYIGARLVRQEPDTSSP